MRISRSLFAKFWLQTMLVFIGCLGGRAGFGQVRDSMSVVQEVDSLARLSQELSDKGQFEEALRAIEEAERMALSAFGPASAAYGACLHRHGYVHHFMQDIDRAEAYYLQAMAIRKKALGEWSPYYAITLMNLGTLYMNKGEYVKAERLYLEVKAIREKVHGKAHLGYATTLEDLGYFYINMGNLDKAESCFLEERSVREKIAGREHPDFATSQDGLAMLYFNKGDFDMAEDLLLESMAIKEKTLGKGHLNYSESLEYLARLYQEKGDFGKAETLLWESRAIKEKVLGRESYSFALILEYLGDLYTDQGKYDEAEPLYLEAKDILEKALGRAHAYYAREIGALANLYSMKGDPGKAEALFEEARQTIKDKGFGKGHRDYATVLKGSASLCFKRGDYKKAEPLYLEAKDILEKMLGTEHPDYAEVVSNLALLNWAKNELPKAGQFFLETLRATNSILKKAAAANPEREMMLYQGKHRTTFETAFSFAQTHPSDSLTIAAYDNALFYNNATLENAIALRNAIEKADTSIQNIYEEYRWRHFVLAKEEAKPIAERDPAKLARWKDEAEVYEKQLVRRSPEFVAARQVTHWDEVRDRLAPGEAAIEFIKYQYHTPLRATDSTHYAALVLRPGDESPHFVFLCEQRQLDARLKRGINETYDFGERTPVGASLTELLWQPIAPLLAGVKTVYYTPAGDLHRLNLAAIVVEREGKERLGSLFHLVPMRSTRHLVAPAPSRLPENGAATAMLFGNIPYEMDSTTQNKELKALGISYSEPKKPNWDTDRGNDEKGYWTSLDSTKTEIDNVSATLKNAGFDVTIREDYAASEETVKQIGKNGPSPNILMFSTHGYFEPDPVSAALNDRNAPIFKKSDNPFIRSGLILAGANEAWRGHPVEGREDGILTAYEVTQLDLRNTELVVLSACQTGLGDIKGSEGVFGLQRAFKIAGAKYLLMSLWEVPDGATAAMMGEFYKNWLIEKMPIRAALEKAQAFMQNHSKEEFQKPRAWAGFVLIE